MIPTVVTPELLHGLASLAESNPVDLRESLAGLDATNLVLIAQAVLHTGGQRASK
jgi:hypothetical protein